MLSFKRLSFQAFRFQFFAVSLERLTIIPRTTPFVNTFLKVFLSFFSKNYIYMLRFDLNAIYSVSSNGHFCIYMPIYMAYANYFTKFFWKNQEKIFEKVVLKLQKPLSVPQSFKHIFLYIWRISVLSLLNLLIIFLILSEKSF